MWSLSFNISEKVLEHFSSMSEGTITTDTNKSFYLITIPHLWVSDGREPLHWVGLSQLSNEMESIAMSPSQETPRIASNSIVNGVFRRPIDTTVWNHWFPWLPTGKSYTKFWVHRKMIKFISRKIIVANGSRHTITYSIYWLREVVKIQLLSQSYALRKPGDEKKHKLPLKNCWKFKTIVTATANQNKHYINISQWEFGVKNQANFSKLLQISPYHIIPESNIEVRRISWSPTKEALDCYTNSPCRHIRK